MKNMKKMQICKKMQKMQKCKKRKKHKKYKSTKIKKKHLGGSYQYKKAKQSKNAKDQKIQKRKKRKNHTQTQKNIKMQNKSRQLLVLEYLLCLQMIIQLQVCKYSSFNNY